MTSSFITDFYRLAFLDHHLKAVNSLVGSDVTEVLVDDVEGEGGQLTLEHIMELMQDLLDI